MRENQPRQRLKLTWFLFANRIGPIRGNGQASAVVGKSRPWSPGHDLRAYMSEKIAQEEEDDSRIPEGTRQLRIRRADWSCRKRRLRRSRAYGGSATGMPIRMAVTERSALCSYVERGTHQAMTVGALEAVPDLQLTAAGGIMECGRECERRTGSLPSD